METASEPTENMSTGKPSANGNGTGAESKDFEVSLLDVLLVLSNHRNLIVGTVLAVTALGLTYAVLAPEKYESTATVARESQSSKPQIGGGSLGLLQQGLGVQLGGGGSGLTASAYPRVLLSREVRLAVVRDTFRFPGAEQPMTFVDHLNQEEAAWNDVLRYTLYLPWTLKNMFGRAFIDRPSVYVDSSTAQRYPTNEEQKALEVIRRHIRTSVSQESGLMNITATAESPLLATEMANSFLEHLRDRVRTIRTKQVRERLAFVESRVEEAERKLREAEDRLAEFLERNQNPTTATLEFERQRLQRQVQFQEQLYSNLQSQVTQVRLEVQRQEPVITTVEEPVPSQYRSAPKRTSIVILSFGFGILLGCVMAFVSSNFSQASFDGEDAGKVERIKRNLIPEALRRRLGWHGEHVE
jgi:uncharacterized protein involved in exopolysaccharide biosynthesis